MENITASVVDDEAKLLKHLDQEIAPLTHIVLERRDNGFDTTYDHFMYDYVGHPHMHSSPPIVRYHPVVGEQHYSRHIISSYSKHGSLVQVREAERMTPDNRAADFFVVSANLHTRKTTEWRITQVTSMLHGANLQTELALSDQPLDALAELQEFDLPDDPLEQVLVNKVRQHQAQRTAAAQTRVVLTNQGCWFCPEGQPAEPLAPIKELVRTVDALYVQFGHLALLRRLTNEIENESTDTMAA